MKFAKFTAVALVAAFLAVGCNHPDFPAGGDDTPTISNKGSLSIENLTIDCRIDESIPDAGLTPSVASADATRTSVDVDNFNCSIINEANEVIMEFKYSERPTEAVVLEAGDYIFKIQSGEVPGAAWESPVYGTSKAFKIVRNQTTTISEIVCSLMQIKVSVTYAADLLERLGEKTLTTVVIGDNSLEFSLTESRSGFFLAPQVNNTIELRISGTYAADKVNFKPVEMTKEVRNVKAGQHSKVHFYIEHAAEGNINVGVTIRDWVTDEVIPCNVADLVTEEEWKDNTGGNEGGNTGGGEGVVNDPSIEWIGYNLADRIVIDDTTTGEIMVRASKGIKELIVQIDSEVLVPALLGGIGLADVMNITYPEKSYDSSNPSRVIDTEVLKSALSKDFGFKIGDEVINKTEVLFSITTFMGALNAEAGNHNFIFTVIDNDGVSKTEILKLKSTGN
jgi:hypothetical protein